MGCDSVDLGCSFLSRAKMGCRPRRAKTCTATASRRPISSGATFAELDELALFGIWRVGIGFRSGRRRGYVFGGGVPVCARRPSAFNTSLRQASVSAAGLAASARTSPLAHAPVVRCEPKPFRRRIQRGHGSAASYRSAQMREPTDFSVRRYRRLFWRLFDSSLRALVPRHACFFATGRRGEDVALRHLPRQVGASDLSIAAPRRRSSSRHSPNRWSRPGHCRRENGRDICESGQRSFSGARECR